MIFPLFLGPPKGVSLTHYNMVANITQLAHPDILMLDIDPNNQEITVAVLPFFHIYAMNCIMTLGLQLGGKLVTIPRFEPEMYIKALVTYKVSHQNLFQNYLHSSSTELVILVCFNQLVMILGHWTLKLL